MRVKKIALPPELDVSAEVTAQTPIIKSLLENLELPEIPVSGDNKQRLQTNNKNLLTLHGKINHIPASLQIVTLPTKINYRKEDSLDLAGMKVVCTYENGDSEEVTLKCKVSPMVLNTKGTQEITVSYTKMRKTVTTTFNVNVATKIVTWAGGTDEEIVDMVEAADNGELNLSEYWAVGDERRINLSAMEATHVGESHVAQTVTFVLMNVGGKELVTPTMSGRNTCSFIVGMKNLLSNGNEKEYGYMNPTASSKEGWEDSARRKWCNNVFKNAVPNTIRGIFKQHKNHTAYNIGSGFYSTRDSIDYFALASEKEVFGQKQYALGEENHIQFEYYKTKSNIIKKIGDNGSDGDFWIRSPWFESSSYSQQYCSTAFGNRITLNNPNSLCGISPFGCI